MKRLLPLLLAALLTACGPSYQTEYELVAPKSRAGKQCANNCYYERQGCMNACMGVSNRCHSGASFGVGFGSYSRHSAAGIGFGGPLYHDRYYDDRSCYYDQSYCEQRCEMQYRQCFTGCGGQVIPHTACVANCAEE